MTASRHAARGRATDAHELLVPIALELAPIRSLLVVDLDDDPTYRTLEPQVLTGPGGDEVVLLAYRHDERLEIYASPGSAVERSGYEGLGSGLEGIHRTAFELARFDVTDDGLQLDVALTAPNGRRFDLRIHEHLAGGRDHFPALAPVGGSFDAPEFFPFLWLPGLSFVPVRGTEVEVRVDERVRTVPRLPLPIGGRRCLMARYDPDVLVCQLNPDDADLPTRVTVQEDGRTGVPGAEIVETDGDSRLTALRVGRGGHTCAVVLAPPLPDLRSLPSAARQRGALLLQADDTTELQARYELTRVDDRVELVIDGFGPWRTRLRRPLLAVLFRLPIFRRWPTTYRFEATLDLAATPARRLSAGWTRSPER
jgi:hypothetical protein